MELENIVANTVYLKAREGGPEGSKGRRYYIYGTKQRTDLQIMVYLGTVVTRKYLNWQKIVNKSIPLCESCKYFLFFHWSWLFFTPSQEEEEQKEETKPSQKSSRKKYTIGLKFGTET